MSIFGSIVSKIFGRGTDSAPTATPGAPVAAGAASTGSSTPAPSASAAAPAVGAATAAAAAATQVDVAAVLTELASKAGQPLDWRKSIVDLLKLLGLDSSLAARKQLAQELHYTGDTDDSATMNIWLHKQVMQKLAENGGKVPDDLKH